MLVSLQVGSLAQWVTLFTLLCVAVPLIRGANAQTIRNLRDEKREAERQLRECTARIQELSAANAVLTEQTNIEVWGVKVVDSIERHEAASKSRDDAMLNRVDHQLRVLGLMADRLGPEREQ